MVYSSVKSSMNITCTLLSLAYYPCLYTFCTAIPISTIGFIKSTPCAYYELLVLFNCYFYACNTSNRKKMAAVKLTHDSDHILLHTGLTLVWPLLSGLSH